MPHRSKQDSVRFLEQVKRSIGERSADSFNGFMAYDGFFKPESVTEPFGNRFEHFSPLGSYFLTDTVTGQYDYFLIHSPVLFKPQDVSLLIKQVIDVVVAIDQARFLVRIDLKGFRANTFYRNGLTGQVDGYRCGRILFNG